MRVSLIALLLLALCTSKTEGSEDPGYGVVLADGSEISYTCMESVPGAALLAAPKMRFVFIRFPQANEGGYELYPDWADPLDDPSWLEREMGQYFAAMSVGQQQPDVAIVTDPENEGQPWSGDFQADWYITHGGAGPLHNEILRKIHDAYLEDEVDPEVHVQRRLTGSTSIEVGLERPGTVSLVVYDVSGSRVRMLAHETLAAGTHVHRWDGRDDQGGAVAAGVYLVKLEASEKVLTDKLVRIR